MHDRSARVQAAANTAASWARARRAAWDDPSDGAVHLAEAKAPTLIIPSRQTPSIPIDRPRADVRSTARAPLGRSRRVAAADETTERSESSGSWLARWLWLPSGSAAAVVLALGGTACAFWLRPPLPAPARLAVVNAQRARPHANVVRQQSTTASRKPTGMLFVTSDPVGARVIVDGRPRGFTPMTVGDLTPAEHALVLDSPGGSVRRSVTIVAGETAQVAESIFAGWISVVSAFDVAIAEGTRAIQLDERNQAMLRPGTHELRFENKALGYAELREVFVKPGEVTALSIADSSKPSKP